MVLSLKLDRSCYCKLLNCCRRSFSSSRLDFYLTNTIVVALISILIISKNIPLLTRFSYFDVNMGILLVTSSIYSLSVSNELLNFQNPGSRFASFSSGFMYS